MSKITVVKPEEEKSEDNQIEKAQNLNPELNLNKNENDTNNNTMKKKQKKRSTELIKSYLPNLDLDKSLEYFRKHNYLLNKRVKAIVNNQTFIGEVVGIDDSFYLQVVTHGMLLHIDSGEIEIL